MRINGNSPVGAAAALSVARPAQQAARPAGPGGGDRLEISGRAREIEMARDAIRNLPDVRQERVDSLREEIRSGRYQVPAEAVAAALMAQIGG